MSVEEKLRKGLTSSPKYIPFWFIYDKEGSILFEKCWSHNQYHYMAKTEKALIKAHVQEILNQVPKPIKLVDLGCGNCEKTRFFIDAILERQDRLEFIPVDMSEDFMLDTSRLLEKEYDGSIVVHPLIADWVDGIKQLRHVNGNKLILWFGGLLNLPYPDQLERVRDISHSMSETNRFVLSMDVTQDPEKIRRAYLDPTGMMAAYYGNVLSRLNREYGANIDMNKLEIEADVVMKKGRNTCSYFAAKAKAKENQTWNIPGLKITLKLEKGEYINISDCGAESTCKYTVQQIKDIIEAGRLKLERIWVHQNQHAALCCMAKNSQ